MKNSGLDALKAVSQTNRLSIVKLISKNAEMNALQILRHFNISQPTLSHHMKILTEAELVKTRNDGLWTYYSLNQETIASLRLLFSELASASGTDEKIAKKIKKNNIDIALL